MRRNFYGGRMYLKTMAAILFIGVAELTHAGVVRAQAPREAIGLSGYWRIDVRQPDGTLVSHREFENAPVQASTVLALILSQKASVTDFALVLHGSICPPTQACSIVYPASPQNSSVASYFRNLSANVSAGSVTFAGTATAQVNGTISIVSTEVSLQQVGASFAVTSLLTQFEMTDPSGNRAPIPVAQGQIVQASVTISVPGAS